MSEILSSLRSVDLAILFSGVAALGTFTLAVLAFFQAKAARRAAEMAQESVDASREMVEEMRETRLAQERPLVKVSIDRSQQYMLFVVVENLGRTPAMDIRFDFSSPLIHPGFSHPERDAPDAERRKVVLSEEVSFFADGLNFLAPNDNVSVFWGGTDDIIKGLREKGLAEKGITVSVSYESVGGKRFENEEWTLNPAMHDELIWLVFPTPEMLMDQAMKLSKKISGAISRDGLKVTTADERRRERREDLERLAERPPPGKTRRQWKRELLGERHGPWWRRWFGG